MAPSAETPAREFDVVVFGASSVTGRRCGAFLRDQGANWAAAGRSASRVASALHDAEGVEAPAVLEADVSDAASLRAMAARTKVVLNLVGPYTSYGEPVIEACIAEGAHYVDLSGEIPFVRRMVARHDVAARRAGVKVVQVCGFEALPADLGVQLALDELDGDAVAVEAEVAILQQPPGLPRASDLVSGGTIQSLVEAAADPDAKHLTDPACLLPGAGGSRAAEVRRRSPIGLLPRLSGTKVIGPMAPAAFINPPIIHRTAALLDQPVVPFREGTALGGGALSVPVRYAAAGALASIQAPLALLGRTGGHVSKPLTGVLRRVLPGSGFGPANDRLEGWRWRMTFTARAADGREATVRAEGEGHPGYLATSRMLAMTGVLLAEDGATPDTAGHVTPAVALGTAVAPRFAAAGLAFG